MKLLIIMASTLSLLVVTQVSTILAGGHGQPTFMWTRTVHVAAGQGPKASELAMKIKKYVEETVGIDVKIRFPVSGQTNRIIFSPEFRNRIDSIIHFNHLNKEIVLSIVDKFIIQVEAQLEDKGVSLSIDKKAKEYLADIGYDEVYGARELGRVIQEKVKKPMAEELIFGALAKGGHVDITIENNEISLKYSSSQDKKKELV